MKFNKLTALILAAATVVAGHANGEIIASANFTGMTASGNTTVAISGTPGVNDFTWTIAGVAGFTYSTPDVNMQTGTGNALRGTTSNTFQGMIGTMSFNTTIPIGSTLTLSFIGEYTTSPGNTANALRFGFVNSLDLDNAFGMVVSTGTSTGIALLRDTGGDDSPLAGSGTNIATGAAPSNNITTNDVYTALFSITRTATDTYSYFGDINGTTLAATSIVGGFNNYNAIVIRNGSVNASFQVDNVSVTLVPEPSAVVLGGLGGLGLLAVLRRRR
jgi:hypothetical protein